MGRGVVVVSDLLLLGVVRFFDIYVFCTCKTSDKSKRFSRDKLFCVLPTDLGQGRTTCE